MIFFLSPPLSAEVYRSVDEDGNVIFSDQPSPGAEEIKLDKIQTIDAPAVKPAKTGSSTSGKKASEKEIYDSVAIKSPGNDEAISANAGNISVAVSVSPALKTGHKLIVYLDGNEVAQGTGPQFDLSNLDRGTHSLAAAVVDGNGGEIKRSAPVSFTLHRHSVQHKPPTTGPTGGKQPPKPQPR